MNSMKIAEARQENLEALFKAYFNNKMTVFLMMIENPALVKNPSVIEKQKIFLTDIYRHFLSGAFCRRYGRAFRWLLVFLEIYPHWTQNRRRAAVRMAGRIYESLGIQFRYLEFASPGGPVPKSGEGAGLNK